MEQSAWDELAQYDQLNTERAANRVFYGFSEAPLLFPPSYRSVWRRPRCCSLTLQLLFTDPSAAVQYRLHAVTP